MKKFLSMLLAAVLCFSMAACGSDTTTDEDDGVTKIALLIPHRGDQSYMDVIANSKPMLEEKYGDAIEYTIFEMGDEEAKWEPANRQAAEEGYDIIISGNFSYEGAMLKVAAEYPEIKYLNFDYDNAEANSLPNVYGIRYSSNEIGYLTGLVAGVKTKTGIIGAVIGMNIPSMNQFAAGYIQGAADVNPDIKVIVAYSDDFTNAPKGKDLTDNMLAAGADVIWGCAGGTGNGVFQSVAGARSEGKTDVWALGVDSDQHSAMSAQPELANAILTSGLKKCDIGITEAVTMIMEGTAPFGTQKTLTVNDNGVGLAENDFYFDNMTEEELATVNSFIEKVKTGEIVVVDEVADPGVFEEYYNKYGLK